MSGYVFVMGPCFSCGAVFSYNPHRVPSIPVEGVRQAICLDCVERANPERKANNLPEIVPHADAYSPIREEEL